MDTDSLRIGLIEVDFITLLFDKTSLSKEDSNVCKNRNHRLQLERYRY